MGSTGYAITINFNKQFKCLHAVKKRIGDVVLKKNTDIQATVTVLTVSAKYIYVYTVYIIIKFIDLDL